MDDKDAQMRDFANRLQKEMVRKGWSQSDIARAANKFMPQGKEFGRHLINYYLRLRGLPTPVYLKALSDALGVDPDVLLPPQERWDNREYVGVQMKTVPENPDEVWLEFKQRVPMGKALQIMQILRE
jgi:transcriptional regulator with XRE-family HTH domain